MTHGYPAARSAPRVGVLAGARRFFLGDRVKRARVSDHGVFMRSLGRAWAVPMTLVFSSGALITLGQKQIAVLVGEYQAHRPLDYVTLALLAITFVIVGGMDLTLLNSAVELRDARLRGVDPSRDPYTRGARLRVWLVSLVELKLTRFSGDLYAWSELFQEREPYAEESSPVFRGVSCRGAASGAHEWEVEDCDCPGSGHLARGRCATGCVRPNWMRASAMTG